jgi:septum site-determining protein MinD
MILNESLKMSKIIVITSGKGGVGKTTTAINLGAAMNYFGKDALIIDTNISTPNVGIHLGSPEVPICLNHVLCKKAQAFEAVYEHESGLKIMPASLSISESAKTDPKKLKTIKQEILQISNYIILDSAAGLGEEASSSMDLADEIIIVTNAEMPAITDALKTIKTAEQKGKKVIGVIVTKVRKDKIELQPETVKDMLEIPILGMIPLDIRVSKSLNQKNPVIYTHPKSKAARAYKEIAARLLNMEYDSDKEKPNLWEKISRRY